VFYSGYTPKDAALAPTHIPTAATPCEACHSKTTFTSFSGTTMSSAKHTAMFTIIGSTCDACHNRVTPALSFYGVGNLQTRPNDHNSGNKATQDCSACHNTNSWGGGGATRPSSAPAAAARNKATLVAAAPTTQQRMLPGLMRRTQFSHFGVTASCAGCHNGQLASGKSAGHIASNNVCENCHVASAWLPARFEHRGVSGACRSCHNAVLASGKPPQHLQTNQDCSACHNPISWQITTFSHQGVIGSCQSCHNSVSAVGKQVQHVVTTQDCATCHNTSSWTIAVPLKRLQPLLINHAHRAPGPKP
jgi:hypothetical protein